jgi:hypothetical protein
VERHSEGKLKAGQIKRIQFHRETLTNARAASALLLITPGGLRYPTFALMVCIGSMGGYYIKLVDNSGFVKQN